MKYFFLFIFLFLLSFIGQGQDYTKYINLSYAELDSLVMLPYQKQDFQSCITLTQVAREKAKMEFGEQDSVYAEYTHNIGFFYDKMGNYKKALPFYIQAKDIQEKTLGSENRSFINSLRNLALLYSAMGNYNKALSFYTQAKDIQEKTLGSEHPDFGRTLSDLASLHSKMGNYSKALPFFIQAKDIQEKTLGSENPDFALTLNNLADLYIQMGDYDKALPLQMQAINIQEKALGSGHPSFAISLSNLAGLYEKMINYDKALPLFIQAKNILEKALGSEHPYILTSLHNLANFYKNMGDYDKALPLYIQVKDRREKMLGIEHPHFLASLNNLAGVHQKMGNYNKALPLYIQVVNSYEKVLGSEHPNFALTLNNLASLYQKMGDYDKALPLHIQTKNIREKVLGIEHPHFLASLNNLALLYQKMGNYEEAWNVLRLALYSQSTQQLEHTFDNKWLTNMQMISYPSPKHIIQAVMSLQNAYNLLEKDNSISNPVAKQVIVSDLVMTLLSKAKNEVSNEKDKLLILSYNNVWLLKSLKVLTPEENANKAFNFADQSKSVLLFQDTKAEETYRLGGLPDSLVKQDKELLKTQSQLQAKLIEKRSKEEKDSLRNELNHIHQDIDVFVEMIKKDYPLYHKLKYQQVSLKVKVEDVQALLDDNSALLEYVIADSVVHIFYVDKKQVLWEKSFVSNKTLKNNIKALHQALSNYQLVVKNKENAYRNYTQKARWFYQKLVAPVLKKDKQNIQNLIIITDGELGHLPFETFLAEEVSQSSMDYHQLHYLVMDYNISYNYSAALWKDNKETPSKKNNGQILAMAANYDIKLDSSMLDVRLPTDQWMREVLNPLPAARKEVEILEEKYQGFFVFDTLASEKTVKEKAKNYAILHFAMHGILNDKKPTLSSLAFTEDNDSIESNFWQAHEIYKTELNADLVVLSACETGYGKFQRGNGIASLARAFFSAGSSALIVSLWQVNDGATFKIMKNLYANLADGMKKDEALRQAKLQYIKTAKNIAAHPAFWSPFIIIGNTQPVHIKKKGGAITMPWIIGGGLVLLAFGGLAIYKSRHKKEVA